MTTIKRFEEIHAWQSAREMVRMVYEVTNLPNFRRDFGLRDQIRRAAVSVMSNIAEGFNAGSDSEFIRFLGYARRSISEAQSQLYVAYDQMYITEDQFNGIFQKANETERQVNALIGYLHRSRTAARYSAKEESGEYVIGLPDDDLPDL